MCNQSFDFEAENRTFHGRCKARMKRTVAHILIYFTPHTHISLFKSDSSVSKRFLVGCEIIPSVARIKWEKQGARKTTPTRPAETFRSLFHWRVSGVTIETVRLDSSNREEKSFRLLFFFFLFHFTFTTECVLQLRSYVGPCQISFFSFCRPKEWSFKIELARAKASRSYNVALTRIVISVSFFFHTSNGNKILLTRTCWTSGSNLCSPLNEFYFAAVIHTHAHTHTHTRDIYIQVKR